MTDLQIWVCVENNVVMMTASTPTLKPLFTRNSGPSSSLSPYYYDSYELGHAGKSGIQGSVGWSRSGTQRQRPSDMAVPYGDTQSEERILPIDRDDAQITKTTEVEVSYAGSRDQGVS